MKKSKMTFILIIVIVLTILFFNITFIIKGNMQIEKSKLLRENETIQDGISYTINNSIGKKSNVLITITRVSGIQKIKYPKDLKNGLELQCNEKQIVGIDVTIDIGKDYIFKVVSDDTEKDEIIHLEQVSIITLNKENITLTKRSADILIPTVMSENVANKAVTWSSSDENIATVDNNGIVRAVKLGTAIITATAQDGSGVSKSCEVTVEEGPLYLFNEGPVIGYDWKCENSVGTARILENSIYYVGTGVTGGENAKAILKNIDLTDYNQIHMILSTGRWYSYYGGKGVSIRIRGKKTINTVFYTTANYQTRIQLDGEIGNLRKTGTDIQIVFGRWSPGCYVYKVWID